jgi:uncharacterized protein (TIGR02246 family)
LRAARHEDGVSRAATSDLRFACKHGAIMATTREDSRTDDAAVRALFGRFHECWNRRDARGIAELFSEDGHVVGFDGSVLDGASAIGAEMTRIFADHKPAAFVGKVREVVFPGTEVALLRAIAGMVPPGKTELNPQVNAIQTLVARKRAAEWRILILQSTPAAFHGRPELVEQMTAELTEVLRA